MEDAPKSEWLPVTSTRPAVRSVRVPFSATDAYVSPSSSAWRPNVAITARVATSMTQSSTRVASASRRP